MQARNNEYESKSPELWEYYLFVAVASQRNRDLLILNRLNTEFRTLCMNSSTTPSRQYRHHPNVQERL